MLVRRTARYDMVNGAERPVRSALTAAVVVVVFAIAQATAGKTAQATAGIEITFLTRKHLGPPHLSQHQRRGLTIRVLQSGHLIVFRVDFPRT